MVKPGDTFKIGEVCPESGIYRLKNCTCMAENKCSISQLQYTIPLAKGNKFPPCKKCGGGIVWEFIKEA